MTVGQILPGCCGTEMGHCLQRGCALLMERWRTSHPGRAWLSAFSADSCLSSDPAAFVPVFRAPGRAHHPLLQIISVPAAPSQREPIPAVPSQTGGAHPALPRAILNLSASSSHRDCSMMEKLLLPLSSLLGLPKNSPEHLKMCSDLLTGEWMRSQGWQGTGGENADLDTSRRSKWGEER